MHPFTPINLLLAPSGCRLMISSQADRLVNYFFRVFIVVVYLIDVVANVELNFNSRSLISRPLAHLEGWMHTLFGISFLVIMFRNSERMGDMISFCIKSLTPEQRSCLFKHSLIALATSIMIYLIDIATVAVHLISVNAKGIHVVRDVSTEVRLLNQWLIGGCFIYTFFVRMTGFMEDNYFIRLNQQISSSGSDPESLAYDRWMLTEDRNKLFATLSVTPIFWFTSFFFKMGGNMMNTMEPSNESAERITSLLPLFSQAGVLFYLIFVCDSVGAGVKKKANDVIGVLISRRLTKEYEPLIDQLRESASKEFTAWYTFDINRKFVLSFISSLITFTVLFIQLARKGID